MKLNKLIKKRRVEKGYTYYRLSKLSGIRQDVIKSIEEGKTSPTWHTLELIFPILGLKIIDFSEFDLDFQPFVKWKTKIDNHFPDKPEYYFEDIPGINEYLVELFYKQIEWFDAVSFIAKKLESDATQHKNT